MHAPVLLRNRQSRAVRPLAVATLAVRPFHPRLDDQGPDVQEHVASPTVLARRRRTGVDDDDVNRTDFPRRPHAHHRLRRRTIRRRRSHPERCRVRWRPRRRRRWLLLRVRAATERTGTGPFATDFFLAAWKWPVTVSHSRSPLWKTYRFLTWRSLRRN